MEGRGDGGATSQRFKILTNKYQQTTNNTFACGSQAKRQGLVDDTYSHVDMSSCTVSVTLAASKATQAAQLTGHRGKCLKKKTKHETRVQIRTVSHTVLGQKIAEVSLNQKSPLGLLSSTVVYSVRLNLVQNLKLHICVHTSVSRREVDLTQSHNALECMKEPRQDRETRSF